ncbi:Protein CBG23810 [Caenorhabditis briggsae]|uniref:Ribosome biogenesis protein NOP53 n=1 Tax=Caenorhabditis briggsae TaxID=6238 RepID=A8WJC4_CAEBR|nr:Protein CBG23810 [Caenorhabditis briggsae]CAP20567.2 Protein CBG23810 [Caenorhabditis briggsae]
MAPGKRTGAAKGSRHNKKYWRKGTDITDIEDAIHDRSHQAATGGIVEDMKDEEIFVVDRLPTSKKTEEPQRTRKQQAALEKITRNITQEQVSLPKPTGKVLKKPAKLPRGNAILKLKAGVKKVAKRQEKEPKFDVWSTDLTPRIPKEKLDNPEAVEHFLKVVKKKQPKTPGKSITTLLPAVEVAQGGASYNPESSEYQEYVTRIAGEEQRLIDSEEKTKRGIEPQWEKVSTKQLHKELDEEEKQRHVESEARKKKKLLNKLTKRQKLGRGAFVEAEDPFLLKEELTGNLRQIKPQGHVLDDRMKSLQRRNMLPIGGTKAKKLKTSLKSKVVEKRSVKEVVKGSRVI